MLTYHQLGAFGFLSSEEVFQNGVLNAGLSINGSLSSGFRIISGDSEAILPRSQLVASQQVAAL
jgi:hypothetical protein